jgi:hypothetical protein
MTTEHKTADQNDGSAKQGGNESRPETQTEHQEEESLFSIVYSQLVTELEDIFDMKARGIISEREFQERKNEIAFGERAMPCKTKHEAAAFIRKIADHELISGVCWLILAVIQICSCYCIIAGVCGIFVAVSRFKSISRIKARDPEIPQKAEKALTSLILLGLVNLVLGGVIGVVLVGFDYFVRGRILENSHVFNGAHSTAHDIGQNGMESPTADEVAALLRRLAFLNQAGGLSNEEFFLLKHEILEQFH